MMLGKRQRPPIKRTTSMAEFSLDLSTTTTTTPPTPQASGGVASYSSSQPFDPRNPLPNGAYKTPGNVSAAATAACGGGGASRIGRRHSVDFLETTDHFLTACSLCKRRLIPGHDIYMYRGDSAFCSLECRQKKMNQDERKEKYSSMRSSKRETTHLNTPTKEPDTTVACL